MIIFLFQSI